MKILCIAPEVEPFAKTGGLADVASALSRALTGLGHEVRLLLPLYREVDRIQWAVEPTPLRQSIRVDGRTHDIRLWQSRLPRTEMMVYFIEAPALFDRNGLYQQQGADYPDNLERFSVFSQAALRILPLLEWQPDLLHCHDWQTALVCAHLALGPLRHDPFFSSMGTVLTIHNLAYQGLFPHEQWPLTQLPSGAFTMRGLEFYGKINCLKGGLMYASRLTTVSPRYAREIQTGEFGCGLDGVLRTRADELTGILNGIDLEEWNPQTDAHLVSRYGVDQLAGKSLCKLALQRHQRLPERHDLLLGMIQRLAEQKGIDIFLEAVESLMTLPLQLVLLGTGDPRYRQPLEELAKRFPDRLAVNVTFDQALAHQIEAGADAFLMPSRFEPCGLNQMYSLRYGTVPIVRRVGGLADTIVDVTAQTIADGTATGFVFEAYTATALVEVVRRALTAFRDHALWTQLVHTGMRQDFSWDRSAREYVTVYERAVAKHQTSKATTTQ